MIKITRKKIKKNQKSSVNLVKVSNALKITIKSIKTIIFNLELYKKRSSHLQSSITGQNLTSFNQTKFNFALQVNTLKTNGIWAWKNERSWEGRSKMLWMTGEILIISILQFKLGLQGNILLVWRKLIYNRLKLSIQLIIMIVKPKSSCWSFLRQTGARLIQIRNSTPSNTTRYLILIWFLETLKKLSLWQDNLTFQRKRKITFITFIMI